MKKNSNDRISLVQEVLVGSAPNSCTSIDKKIKSEEEICLKNKNENNGNDKILPENKDMFTKSTYENEKKIPNKLNSNRWRNKENENIDLISVKLSEEENKDLVDNSSHENHHQKSEDHLKGELISIRNIVESPHNNNQKKLVNSNIYLILKIIHL